MAASMESVGATASYDVNDLSTHVAEAVGHAIESREPVLITDQGAPLAAIVSIDELERLYEMRELTEVRQVVRDFEAAEARGEVTWYTQEEIDELECELLAELASNPGGAPKGPLRPG